MMQASFTRISMPAISYGTENPSSSPICTAQRSFDPSLLDQRLWSLSHLFHSLRSQWGRDDFVRFLDVYFAADPLDPERKENCIQKILLLDGAPSETVVEEPDQTVSQREHRIFGESARGITVYHRRDFPSDRIKEVVGRHDAIHWRNPPTC